MRSKTRNGERAYWMTVIWAGGEGDANKIMDTVNNYGEWMADVRIKAAGHIYFSMNLCLSLSSYTGYGIDINKTLKIIC